MPNRHRLADRMIAVLAASAGIALSLGATRAGAAPASITFTVNSPLDRVDTNAGDGQCQTAGGACTLRAAIMEADQTSGAGATIIVPAGTYSLTIPADITDTANTGDLNLTTPASGNPLISLQGAGAGSTIIDANGLDRVLLVAVGRTASLSGLTLRGGFIDGANGGGLYNAGTVTLDHVTTSSNVADRKKTARKPACAATKPPASGPRKFPSMVALELKPITPPRRSAGLASLMKPNSAGKIPATKHP